MSEPFVGEIRMFAGNYAPRGWAFCDGQLLAVNQFDALFSLYGTNYGGDGRTTFGLPDMRGRLPIHMGSGPGLTPRTIGTKSGAETVTVTENQLPTHTHALRGADDTNVSADPAGRVPGHPVKNVYRTPQGSFPGSMDPAAVSAVGGSLAHTNLQPFLCVHFIVALYGIYPSRQ